MLSSSVSLHIDGYDCDHHFYTTASYVCVDGEMRVPVLNKNSDLIYERHFRGNCFLGSLILKMTHKWSIYLQVGVTGYPLPTYSLINSLFQRKLKNSF